MFKKIASTLIVWIMLAAMLAGCGNPTAGPPAQTPDKTPASSQAGGAASPSSTAGKPYAGVEITALMEGHPSSTALDKIKSEFEDETGIKVNLEIIPYAELPKKAMLCFTQKSGDYDLVFNDITYSRGHMENGYILPLDDFIASQELNKWYDADDFLPAYQSTAVIDGKTYGLPVYGESTFLMYRKDLFEEYGVEVPKTMDELQEAAQTIYEKTNGEIAGITLRGQQDINVVYAWGGFLWAYGGRWFDESGKLALDSAEAIKGTQVFVDLLNNYGPLGFSNFGWQENRLLFQQGKAAMTIDATVNGAYCEDPAESEIVGKVGYAPVPGQVEKGYGGPAALAVHSLYINAFSENPEAAFLFGSWATNAATQEKCLQVEPHCGMTSQKALTSDAFKEKYGAFSDAMMEALKVSNKDFVPTNATSGEIISRTATALSQCLSKSKTVEAALTEVTSDINTNVLKAG